MKSEELIKQTLYAKLAIFVNSAKDDDRLLEHIRMLDWVLSDGRTRSITQILDAWDAWPKSSSNNNSANVRGLP